MNYCSQCGATVDRIVPPGDDRPRYVCRSCETIHYQNPRLVVGCIPEWEDKILICRRAIKPCYGLWTLPAGYLENGESVSEGAMREAEEEAHARLKMLQPYALYNICHINQVYLFFRAKLVDLNFRPGSESLEVQLVSTADIPWDDLAFRAVERVLKQYIHDRREENFQFHMGDIRRKIPGFHP